MNESIAEFLAGRKEERLKKKLKEEANEAEHPRIRQEVENEFSLSTWLPDAARRAAQLSMVSHPGKFSHPGAKTSAIIADNPSAPDGYLRTGNVGYELDIFGNAAAMDVYKFLCLPLNDGETVLKHLEKDSPAAQQLFSIPGMSYADLRSGFLAIKQGNQKYQTDGRVKQVYFPVGPRKYHLLSILTPSGILTLTKNRIDTMRFSETTKQARDNRRRNQYHEGGYDDIPDLTVTVYGGTKPQNVSVLNNQNAGRAYLLNSAPPDLEQRQVRLPTRHFFKNSLAMRRFQDSFQALDRLMRSDVNNMHIREGIRNTLHYLIDHVLQTVFKIRTSTPGWSEAERYQNLPLAQRIWLDDAYSELRKDTDDWLDEIADDFARWIIKSYQYLHGNDHVSLSDDEFRELARLAEQAITADREFFK